MPTLLAIEASPRFGYSISRKLIAVFVEKWKAATPGGSVVVRDLVKTDLPFVDLAWIGGAFNPPEAHPPESAAAIKVSDDLVAELKAADRIVIGTPMYNFNIPAVLKAYITTSSASVLRSRSTTMFLSPRASPLTWVF
jgi:FMN-dependent NADH-azoreductase